MDLAASAFSCIGHAARETLAVEHTLAVIDDRLAFARQSTPSHGRRQITGATRQSARLISGLRKNFDALNSGSVLTAAPRAGACARLRRAGRRLGSCRPRSASRFSMRTIASAQARARQRIDRHQRRMRIALVEVFADHAGVVQDEVAIDQGRRLIGIEVEQVFRRLGQIDQDAS